MPARLHTPFCESFASYNTEAKTCEIIFVVAVFESDIICLFFFTLAFCDLLANLFVLGKDWWHEFLNS